MAGSLEGQLVVMQILEGRLVLRFNNTGLAVDRYCWLEDSVSVAFSDSDNVFASLLGGFTLTLEMWSPLREISRLPRKAIIMFSQERI